MCGAKGPYVGVGGGNPVESHSEHASFSSTFPLHFLYIFDPLQACEAVVGGGKITPKRV